MEIEYKPNNENIKTFTIGAQTQETAEKYARFLWERTKFGGHAGLPQEIHNAKRNRTLDHTANMYDMIDVFSLAGNTCQVGTVVNFKIDDANNVEGNTYVYPVTDTSKPMGYMLSEAKPDAIGVCVVSGVIEVPLVYMKGSSDSTFDRTNYVEYDIEECAFKFSNTGYPVFNVYQDVDGDWIAIILFGDTSSDWQYDGPFATMIAGVTGSTMYVNVAEGDVVDDDSRYTCGAVVCGDDDLTDDICLNTGETLWLGVYDDAIVGSTYSYFVSDSDLFDVAGSTIYYRIAENDNGKLRQLQYGDAFVYRKEKYIGPFDVVSLVLNGIYDEQDGHIVGMYGTITVLDTSNLWAMEHEWAGSVIIDQNVFMVEGGDIDFRCENDTLAHLYLYKDPNSIDYKLKVVGDTDDAGYTSLAGTFYSRICDFENDGTVIRIQYGNVVQPQYVSGSTSSSSGVIQDLYSATKAIAGTTVSSPAICITDSNDYVNIVGGTNTYVTRGIHGEIIVGSTYSYNPTYQDLTSSVTGGIASVGITESNSKVNFEGMGNNYITKIRSNATIEERQSWGTHYNSETGEYELKDAGWRGIIPLKIFDNFSYDSGIMTEVSMLSEVDGSTVSYPLIVPDTTDEELSIIADVSLGKISTSDIPKELIDKALDFALDRISNDKSPYYNSTLEDPDDEALRNIPNADSIIVYGVVPALSSYVSGNTSATLGIYGTTNTVTLFAGENTTITGGTDGEIIINSVGGGTWSSFNYTGSFSVECWDVYDEDEETTFHHYQIYDTNNRDDNYSYAGWVHIGNQKYHVFSISDDTFVDGDVVYLIGTFNESNELSSLEFRKIQTFFPTINDNQFCVRICYATNGKMYQTQYGDIVQPARLVGDGETVEIHSNVISAIGGGGGGTVQGLYSAIKGGTPAICITGSAAYVPIAGGINTYTERDSSGAIVVGCTASGGGGGSINNEYVLLTGATVHDLIAGNRYIVLCPRVFVGGVLRNQYNSETTIRNALINSGHTNVPSTGYSDDEGNMMLVLPENLTNQTSVEVKVNTKGCSVLVVTADSKKIILADSDGEQGVNAGVYTTEIRPTDTNEHWLFVYINGVSWPSSYEDEIHGSIIQQAISKDGGCWILIPM